ncbi:MAG: hypothetical protein HYX69_07870 [Planctomycetia bacterium]|nr:hypothetical protein [Planctomycetia bacterium]
MKQYLALEDATLLYQMQVWQRHPDSTLRDLARRFLERDRLRAIDDPVKQAGFADAREAWERELRQVVSAKGFNPDYYALRDDLRLTIYDPYTPEKDEEEQDPYNAIFIQPAREGRPREISTLLPRLAPVTGARSQQYRYYVPEECRDDARTIAARSW